MYKSHWKKLQERKREDRYVMVMNYVTGTLLIITIVAYTVYELIKQ